MNEERLKGLARLRLALEVGFGLKASLTQAEARLLDVSLEYDGVNWAGQNCPTPLWDTVKRECMEVVYAFHLEAIPDDKPDPNALIYGLLKQIEANDNLLPNNTVRSGIIDQHFIVELMRRGLLTQTGRGFIFGPKARAFVTEYETARPPD